MMPAQKRNQQQPSSKETKLNLLIKKTSKAKTRSSSLKVMENENNEGISKKRPSEDSQQSLLPRKRTAFGDLTNASVSNVSNKTDGKSTTSSNMGQFLKPPLLRLTTKNKSKDQKKKPVASTKKTSLPKPIVIETDPPTEIDSAYFSLSQDSSSSSQSSVSSDSQSASAVSSANSSPIASEKEDLKRDVDVAATTPVLEYDLENLSDPNQVAHYAQDIFTYLKSREQRFELSDYMDKQAQITPTMRAILVDWMVEVQENFELNHETLYLAVKVADHFLENEVVARESLQLVGSTALFIACKFDERTPPVIDDFIFVCDDAYNRAQLIRMEMTILKSIGFDLGIPLSYRFLRRYAKVAKISMQTLTLARYVLELSLLEYKFVTVRDSLKAAAALFLALKMENVDNTWTHPLVTASGQKPEDFVEISKKFNDMLKLAAASNMKTIHSKYSHRVFFEVAKLPPLETSALVEGSDIPN